MPLIIPLAQAKTEGLPRYFTGRSCKHGHISERRTSDCVCIECDRARDRGDYNHDYYLANRDRLIEMVHGYYQENRETILAHKLIYSRLHAAQVQVTNKRWRERHPEQAAQIIADWKEENPDKVRAAGRRGAARRRALKKGAPVGLVPAAKLEEMIAAATRCPDCGLRFTKKRPKAIDHVAALSVGGYHDITNLRIICRSCNSSKGARLFTSSGQGMLI